MTIRLLKRAIFQSLTIQKSGLGKFLALEQTLLKAAVSESRISVFDHQFPRKQAIVIFVLSPNTKPRAS